MVKYQEIIEKLTLEQKLSLLSDISSLAGEEFAELGLRCITETSMDEMNTERGKERYPSFSGLVNSWNTRLLSEVSDSLAKTAKARGTTLLHTPSANVAAAPYTLGLSEDPYLAGVASGVAAGAGKRVGIKTCLSDPALTETEVEFSDLTPSARALNEYFAKPFELALKYGAGALETARTRLGGEYKNVNEEWLKKLEKKTPVIYDCKDAQDILSLVRSGDKLCKNGSYEALKEAAEKYTLMREAFEAGQISLGEIEAECRQGKALSPDDIDTAVDKVIEFTFACKNMKATGGAKEQIKPEDLAQSAAEESVVLLKNDKALPLKKRESVAIVGDLANIAEVESVKECAEALAKKRRIKFAGYARGYDFTADRSDSLINEALNLANRAETVIVVLGYDENSRRRAARNRTCKLPANQLALVAALKNTKAKIVAVVAGGYPDMKFDESCQATLLAALDGGKSAKALMNVLTGKANPSGKLANTCYDDTDERFAELRAYKEMKRNKVGTFYGYRHYDSAELSVRYPFGHGLSYTKFAYSGLKISAGILSFTVKNKGKRAGAEVVQVYVGKRESALVNPKKELKAFFKVGLRRGKSRRIRVDLKQLDLGVWDERKKKFVTEMGEYEIFIGSSCKDIRLRKTFRSGAERLETKKERSSDYLQTYSNIHAGGYCLEPPVRIRKKRKEGLRKGMIGASVFVLCLDIAYAYFYYVRWMPKAWWVYLAVALVNALPMGLAVLLTVKKRERLKSYMEMSMKQKIKQREKLNIDDLAEELPYEQLFAEEFKPVYTAPKADEEKETERETKALRIVPFDREFTLPVVCEQFMTFTHERGVDMDGLTAKRLLSAFAASRLIVVKCSDGVLMNNFLPLLGEYFGTAVGVEVYDESSAEDGLLYKKNFLGETELTGAARSIIDGEDDEDGIRIAVFKELRSKALKPFLGPIVRFIDQPDREVSVSIKTKADSARAYEIPAGTWFIVALSGEEKITDIPKYILDMASVVELNLKPGLGAKLVDLSAHKADGENDGEDEAPLYIEHEKTPVKRLIYPQFKKLVENACRESQLDELLWKRVDKIEEYVNGFGEYRIENKLWQRMERFVSVALALGCEAEEALDCMTAQHLVYGMLPTLKESKKDLEEKFSHTVENICGEGHVPHTVKAIKEEELDV
ncbi:MAG: glycoside hydrolase family 3 C-terminal domain-containing protein [Clostridia bacterium]|nr:glycoside hydrolase family 3 C-terminal domain-containing protein [Clostridia bacterium]